MLTCAIRVYFWPAVGAARKAYGTHRPAREIYLQNCPKLSYWELKTDEGKSALARLVF